MEKLKDKSRTSAEIAQGVKRNVLNRSTVTTTTNERWVTLSDAEEEIEKLKFYIDQIPESGKAALKEIQTLVELLKYTGEELASIRHKWNWGYTPYDGVYQLQKKITQTLKKYE